MRTYLTKLILQLHKPEITNDQLDLQWHLIKAENLSQAFAKAYDIGLQQEVSNSKFSWAFIGIETIQELDLNRSLVFSETQDLDEDPYWLSRIKSKQQAIKEEMEVEQNLPVF